ncbi:MAG TPA: GntR family transcriptional regulator [Burkholderiales bacterium]|jgi:GntR family transcriptional regulator of vanillate catabolism
MEAKLAELLARASAKRSRGKPRRGKALEAAEGGVVTLAQSVTDALRRAITEGEFQPEERLHEESLAERLKVSRTPIRAALHGLTVEGLVEYVPNRGYSVRKVDAERLIAIFDIRGVLEGLAARLAAENGMDEATQAEYRAALEEGDRILSKGQLLDADQARFSEVNGVLHEAILHAAGNSMLGDMMRVCFNIPILSDRNVLWRRFEWLRRSHDDHYRLFDAIVRREGARAEQLMREHVHSVKLHMREQIEDARRVQPPGKR